MAWLNSLYDDEKLDKYLVRLDEGSRCAIYAWIDCSNNKNVTIFLRRIFKSDKSSYNKLESRIGTLTKYLIKNKQQYEEYKENLKGIIAIKTPKYRLYGFKIDSQIVLIEGRLKQTQWPSPIQARNIVSYKRRCSKLLEEEKQKWGAK